MEPCVGRPASCLYLSPVRFVMSIQSAIESKLQEAFQPLHQEVVNESYKHSVPPGSESHFMVVLVTGQFENTRKVQRHQQVYAVLKEEMAGAVHALALHTYTPQEWQAVNEAPASPNCMGGSKQDG